MMAVVVKMEKMQWEEKDWMMEVEWVMRVDGSGGSDR